MKFLLSNADVHKVAEMFDGKVIRFKFENSFPYEYVLLELYDLEDIQRLYDLCESLCERKTDLWGIIINEQYHTVSHTIEWLKDCFEVIEGDKDTALEWLNGCNIALYVYSGYIE